MLNKSIEVKNEKPLMFQVSLLNNNVAQEVEVQEAEHVDFLRVQEYLKHGGAVFITSKRSQKLSLPRENKAHQNKKNA